MSDHSPSLPTEITALAARVLGNAEVAQQWLNQPAVALGGAVPVDLLSNPEGLEAVQDLLMRIEYGVYC
jgi:putative toxin-antitoxin system antitoxin component (TIGR02293 family)